MIVSNTSPITNLSALGELDLLQEIFGEISIPEAVFHEIVQEGEDNPGAEEIERASWIDTESVEDTNLVIALNNTVDIGEAEAIALAVENGADLLLLDDRIARRTADQYDLQFIGLLGVLLLAKRKNIIETVRPFLMRLREEAGFWISDTLVNRILQEADE